MAESRPWPMAHARVDWNSSWDGECGSPSGLLRAEEDAWGAEDSSGDNQGRVGIGVGKARGVPDSIRKGAERARRNMRQVNLWGTTIPHEVEAKHAGTRVLLRPASPGTGVVAGGAVRAVVEAAGIKDILSKSLGSANILNVAYATFKGLTQLVDPNELAEVRGRPASEVAPFWSESGK